MWFLMECENNKLLMMFLLRTKYTQKLVIIIRIQGYMICDQNFLLLCEIFPMGAFILEWTVWWNSITYGTKNQNQKYYKCIKVNIWKNDQTNHSAFKTNMENDFVPKYSIIYCCCACNCGIVFMSQIDALKSYTFFDEKFKIIFIICIKVIQLSLPSLWKVCHTIYYQNYF